MGATRANRRWSCLLQTSRTYIAKTPHPRRASLPAAQTPLFLDHGTRLCWRSSTRLKMADPLSISASVLAVVTATMKSAKELTAAVKRYKDRDKTLNRLHQELEDLVNVLDSLQQVVDEEASILAVLKGPVDRCGQVCRAFEEAMEKFSKKSKTGLRDWARMEFASDDIHGFMESLANYKATILVGLGTITMYYIALPPFLGTWTTNSSQAPLEAHPADARRVQ